MELKCTSKRQREDDSISQNTYRDGPIKKFQQSKIYSEAHHRTIQMMMEAQKILQRKVHTREAEREHEQEELQSTENYKEGNYRQKPHWPCISKVRY